MAPLPAEKARSLWPGVRQRWQIAEEEAAIAFLFFFYYYCIFFCGELEQLLLSLVGVVEVSVGGDHTRVAHTTGCPDRDGQIRSERDGQREREKEHEHDEALDRENR